MLYVIFLSLSRLLELIELAIVVKAVMSWIYPQGRVYWYLSRFLEPILRPFQKISYWIMNRTGLPIDFSPWMAIIAINLITQVLWRVYSMLTWR